MFSLSTLLVLLGLDVLCALSQGITPTTTPVASSTLSLPSPGATFDVSSLDTHWRTCFEDNGLVTNDPSTIQHSCENLDTTIDRLNDCCNNDDGCPRDVSNANKAYYLLYRHCEAIAEVKKSFTVQGYTSLLSESTRTSLPTTFAAEALSTTNPGPEEPAATTSVDDVTSRTSLGEFATSTTSQSSTSTPTPTDGSLGDQNKSKSGMSTGAKAGLGVGLGLGIPLMLAAIAAVIITRKRRQSRPYGAVLSSDKGGMEDGNSAHMDPHDMQHTSYESPFLPPVIAHNRDQSAQEPEQQQDRSPPAMSEREPMSSESRHDVDDMRSEPPFSPTNDPPGYTDRPIHGIEDGGPRAVSPVSPITPSSSRPTSLRSPGSLRRNRHDL